MENIDATVLVRLQAEMLARQATEQVPKVAQQASVQADIEPSPDRTNLGEPPLAGDAPRSSAGQYPLAGRRQKYPLQR
jgi:hypothetical protein